MLPVNIFHFFWQECCSCIFSLSEALRVLSGPDHCFYGSAVYCVYSDALGTHPSLPACFHRAYIVLLICRIPENISEKRLFKDYFKSEKY